MATSAWLHVPTNMRLTECLESVLKDQRPQCLPALLANYREHGVVPTQGSSGVAGLVGCSNAKLSTSKTKFDGLCVLSVLVKDSSTEVFQQHCLSWLRSLQQVIQAQAPGATVRLAVGVLADLLQYSAMLPELAREVGLNWLLGVLTSLLGLQAECELTALEGMAACMTHYPRACGSLRDKLGAFFLARITSTDPTTQEMACRCYGRLPCLGGALERGVGTSRAEAWANQLHCLLASANSTLAQIYEGAEAEGTVAYEGPGLELPFPALDEADPLLLLQLQQRYQAACLALQHTLSVDPQSAVVVPVRQLLNLVCRALSVGPKSISVTGDGSMRLLVLPAVHSNTLTMLSALITAVRGGMVQYAAVLQKVFSQTISAWTPASETSGGQQKAFSSVRVALYSTLGLWVQVGGASAGLLQGSPSHSELLFSHLLGDLSPGAEGVKLRAGAAALGELVSLGGRPGPRRSKAPDGTPSLQRKTDLLANQDACLMALKVLRRIIMTSGSLLKEEIHKRLHDLVIPLCVRLQQQLSSRCTGASEAAGGSSGQYASAQTRRELYRLLLALVLVPSTRWPAPLSCAVSILSHGRRDRSLKVASFCGEALTVCNGLLHPRAPTLCRPPRPPPGPPRPQCPPSGLPPPATLSPAFPPRHALGPAALLGSLENHLSLGPPDPPPPGPEALRPVFVRYDREEAEDVEISLASDSDDSVVIVPPGTLGAESPPGALAPPPPPDGGGSAAAAPDGAPPPADLPSSLLAASEGAALNSFPPSAASLLAPPPDGPGGAPPGGALPGGAQLQQMLMLPPGPAVHQLAPQNRHLHGPAHGPAHPLGPGAKDSAVININSSDEEEEEEEEDLDEDELGEEEEEEDGMEEEEEEEGSDFQDEEYDDYEDEEAEELEEEEEQDGDMPPLEGAEQREVEGKVEEEEGPEVSGVEGEMGGIEEVQTNRAAFGAEQGERLQEVESIGVMEEAREVLEEERGDPTMPQILCVTGGSLEEREEEQKVGQREEEQEEEKCWRPATEISPPPGEELAGGETGPLEPPSLEEPGVCAETAPSQPGAPPPGSPPGGASAPPGPPQLGDGAAADLQATGAEDESHEDVKGLKRKREREEEDTKSAEKRKVEEGGVASMLADFIACPPDEEEGGSGSSLPCLD